MSDMDNFARYTLAMSNLLMLKPLRYAHYQDDKLSALVILFTAIASYAMHISETKHSIDPGPFITPWSYILLNVDRVMALISAAYFAQKWIMLGYPSYPARLMVAGAICSFLGEKTMNVPLYTLLHLIWHYTAYASMAEVLSVF